MIEFILGTAGTIEIIKQFKSNEIQYLKMTINIKNIK